MRRSTRSRRSSPRPSARSARSESIGVGTPGAIHPSTGLLQNSNSVALNGKPLARDLAERLGREIRHGERRELFRALGGGSTAPARMRASFSRSSSARASAAASPSSAASSPGRNRIAGEWGHNPLPWMTPTNGRARNAIAENAAASRRFSAARHSSGIRTRDRPSADGPRDLRTLQSTVMPARSARSSNTKIASRAALAHVTNILDPDVIVLGGGLSNLAALYADVPPLMQRYVFSKHASM